MPVGPTPDAGHSLYALRHGVNRASLGWAQVRYHWSLCERYRAKGMQYDLYYVKNHSWFLDLIVLIF